jgi:hypothetical protein
MRLMRWRVECKDPTISSDTGIILYYHNIIPVIITKYCYCYTNMHARTITIILEAYMYGTISILNYALYSIVLYT